MLQLQSRGIKWCDQHYRPLPVDAVVRAAEALTDAQVGRRTLWLLCFPHLVVV